MLAQKIIAELQFEAISTTKMLERCPAEKFGWKPHEKSMTLGRLAAHVAEIPFYISETIRKDGLDFATADWKLNLPVTTAELVQLFKDKTADAITDLESASDEHMRQDWTLRNGDHVIFTMPRIGTLRSFAMSHLIHHRGQLSVYLRLLDIPVPSIYGPSADEAA